MFYGEVFSLVHGYPNDRQNISSANKQLSAIVVSCGRPRSLSTQVSHRKTDAKEMESNYMKIKRFFAIMFTIFRVDVNQLICHMHYHALLSLDDLLTFHNNSLIELLAH